MMLARIEKEKGKEERRKEDDKYFFFVFFFFLFSLTVGVSNNLVVLSRWGS